MIQVDYNTACSKTKGDDGLVKHLSVKENIKIDLSASVEFLGIVFFVDTLEIKHGFLNFIKGGETIAYKYLKTDITLEPKSDEKIVIKEYETSNLTLDELREVWKSKIIKDAKKSEDCIEQRN